MKITFAPKGWTDYLFWQDCDGKLTQRINDLIRDTSRSPFMGIGKPEPLRGDFQGWWARRISDEHRLVYRIVGSGEEQRLEIASCRFHYRR